MASPIKQRGLTLIELMVAMVAGVVVLLAVTTLISGTLSANTTNLRYVRINQDLRSVLEAVTKDLARAGEWALADDIVHTSMNTDLLLSGTSGSVTATAYGRGSVLTSNAFSFPNAATALTNRTLVVLMKNSLGVNTRYNLTITGVSGQDTLALTLPSALPSNKLLAGSWTVLNPFAGVVVNAGANCVLASYDLDGDGVQDANERFGFRLTGTTIQATTTSTSCTAGQWEGFTDPDFLSISAFNVESLGPAAPVAAPNLLMVDLDQYLIGVTGALVKETTTTRTVQQLVKVRNNAYN